MDKLPLFFLEVNITNVCNYNCTHCKSFNNYSFSGHQLWDDYADAVKTWGSKLHLQSLALLGGEPMLNPDFLKWVDGLTEAFPESELRINTNGSQLERWPELYKRMVVNKNIILDINAHGDDNYKNILTKLSNWVSGNLKKETMIFQDIEDHWVWAWNRIKLSHWPDCPTYMDYYNLPDWVKQECNDIYGLNETRLKMYEDRSKPISLTDDNNIKITIQQHNIFNESALHIDKKTNKLVLHKSDPDRAIKVCDFSCPQLYQGKLYKCSVMSTLPEFVKQNDVEMSDEELDLLDQYAPAKISWPYEKLKKFIEDLNLRNSIKQCSFCPEKYVSTAFEATQQKITFFKKKKLRVNI